MFKVTVLDRQNNQIGSSAKFKSSVDAQKWIDDGVAGNWWGKPERWVKDSDLAIQGLSAFDAVESKIQDTTLGSAVFYRFLSDYLIEIDDITQEVANAEAAKLEAKQKFDSAMTRLASATPSGSNASILLDLIEIAKQMGGK